MPATQTYKQLYIMSSHQIKSQPFKGKEWNRITREYWLRHCSCTIWFEGIYSGLLNIKLNSVTWHVWGATDSESIFSDLHYYRRHSNHSTKAPLMCIYCLLSLGITRLDFANYTSGHEPFFLGLHHLSSFFDF